MLDTLRGPGPLAFPERLDYISGVHRLAGSFTQGDVNKMRNYAETIPDTTETNPAFLFLNRLRESGVVNMFGAASYLAEGLDMESDDARAALTSWMRWVSENPANRDL